MQRFLHSFLILALSFNFVSSQENLSELRGVWLTNVDSQVLDSRENIAEAMQFLADHHFNVVFPVVWNDAQTLYPSEIMDSLFNVRINPRYAGRDPLAEVISEAHSRGIAVIPWFEYGFASSYLKNGGLILEKKPNWAERDNHGKLLTKNGFEWMNPYHPEVQEFIISLVTEVVKNYDIDGIQGDDRLPANPVEGGYSDFTQKLYATEHGGKLPPTNFRDENWQKWRADKLTTLCKNLTNSIRSLKPDILISWAPSVFPWCYEEYLQDWPAWIRANCADLVIPQVYRYSFPEYKSTLREMLPEEIDSRRNIIFPGILMNVGEYVIPEEYLLKAVAQNRKSGYNGEVFFFYEGLRKNDDQLANALLNTFYQKPAKLPDMFRR
ncbi:MAG: family 10 glycosylhydrolase [Candidatus Marinimicrobia bacterium]|nr:family 10 glycosylhydrolase [Candidatus Neomarinimicrobiota bacterium]